MVAKPAVSLHGAIYLPAAPAKYSSCFRISFLPGPFEEVCFFTSGKRPRDECIIWIHVRPPLCAGCIVVIAGQVFTVRVPGRYEAVDILPLPKRPFQFISRMRSPPRFGINRAAYQTESFVCVCYIRGRRIYAFPHL